MSKTLTLAASGLIIGSIALMLGIYGNPANMGVCVACFLRDVAGGLKLHSAGPVQYMRPEIFGFIFGAYFSALAFKEFRPSAGSSPLLRFTLGFLMMVGCLVFLGCPLRMVLRIAGGDWNALIGLFGFIIGIGIGAWFLKKDFALPPNQAQSRLEGTLFPILCAIIFALVLWQSELFAASEKGPGASHAPLLLSLLGGLIIGVIVQRTRFCFIGMASHIFLFKKYAMAIGITVLTLTVLAGNIATGAFHPGFEGQAIAHNDGLWNFLSMLLVGLCGAFLSGCPLRQLVGAGQGNGDAVITTLGMLLGAAFAHNFSLASSPAGVTEGGKAVIVSGILFALLIGVVYARLRSGNTSNTH